MIIRVLLLTSLMISFGVCFAQKAATIANSTSEYIFTRSEIRYLKDSNDKLTISQVSGKKFDSQFKMNWDLYPGNYDVNAAYWYKVVINFPVAMPANTSVFELFDQTTDRISIYKPLRAGGYSKETAGESLPFERRLYKHKNVEFLIDSLNPGTHTFYFNIKSKNKVNVIIVYRTFKRFVYYTLTEYISFGIFYGMILIFCFHNLLMFFAIRRRQYLYYVLYILSVGLYEMSVDGIAFQYLWPNAPLLNDYMYGVALYFVSIFALIFASALLQVKDRTSSLFKVIQITVTVRTLFFLYCFSFDHRLFALKYLEIVPLFVAFYTGVHIYKGGFKPARFFVFGYSFLFLGFLIKGLGVLGLARFLPFWIAHYSLTFSFVIEMVLLSFSIGDQVRLLRKEKDIAQGEAVRQLQINVELKDQVNKELESMIDSRTKKVVQQATEIRTSAQIIERQNQNLIEVNELLKGQAEEISRMNLLLENDNVQLKYKIEKVNDDRILSRELSYDDFLISYPDKDACYKILADLKWSSDYSCIRCGNANYCNGRIKYNRRCTKCTYEESVMLNTIFHNTRIPIVKAFYLVYLVYNSKGNITSKQLFEKLGIRQSTCWAYAIRVKRVMDEQKKNRKRYSRTGWTDLILEKAPISNS